MNQTIRNRDGTLIGTIRACNSDVIVAYNVDGTPIGTYYISRDTWQAGYYIAGLSCASRRIAPRIIAAKQRGHYEKNNELV